MKDYKFLVKFNLASYEVNIFFKVFSYLPPVFVMLWLSERVWGELEKVLAPSPYSPLPHVSM